MWQDGYFRTQNGQVYLEYNVKPVHFLVLSFCIYVKRKISDRFLVVTRGVPKMCAQPPGFAQNPFFPFLTQISPISTHHFPDFHHQNIKRGFKHS